MDIRSILITPPNESHRLESSAGNSASNIQPIAKITSASTPSTVIHETTAIAEGPVPDLDPIAEGALPCEGFDESYDNSRLNSPGINADPDKGLPDLPPFKENSGRREPPHIKLSPGIAFPANSQLVDTAPAASTSGVSVRRTTATTSPDVRPFPLPLPKRKSSLASGPIDTTTPAPCSGINIHETTSTNSRNEPLSFAQLPGTTSPITSRRPKAAARSSNRIPDDAEIFDVDAWVTRPKPAARFSNRIPDDAEIFDVDAWEARRCKQATHPPSAPSSQASTRTLSESEQIVVDFLASNSHCRGIPRGPSGSRTGSNAKSENGNPFPEQQIEPRFYIDIETAFRNKIDDQLGAALFYAFCNDYHKRNETPKGKQKEDGAPFSPLFPSIDNDSSVESESSNEDEANVEYDYNVRACTQTCYGNELKAIKAHPGNAVWALVESRLNPVSDPRKWEAACNRCSMISETRMAHYCYKCNKPVPHFDEQREQTIPLEEAAVDDKKNQWEGAAPYNPNLYTTTSSMRELRVKPFRSWAEFEDPQHNTRQLMSSNPSPPPPSDQVPSSGSNDKGKERANVDGNSNKSQPTPPLTSGQATSPRSRSRDTGEANGNVNSNARGTQAPSPPPPSPPSRSSRRNRPLTAPQPQAPLPPPAPTASSSRRSQRHAPSPAGQTFDRINAMTPEQVQTFYNNKTEEANKKQQEQKKWLDNQFSQNGPGFADRSVIRQDAIDTLLTRQMRKDAARAKKIGARGEIAVSDDDEGSNEDGEQGERDREKIKKSVSWDWQENGTANSKRKASEAVDVDEACGRAHARRKTMSDSSNGSNKSGASQKSKQSAAPGAEFSASVADSSAAASKSGTGTSAPGNEKRKSCDSSPSSNVSQASKKSGKSAASGTSAAGSGTGTSSSGTKLTVPDVVVAYASDPVTYSTPPVTPPRSKGSHDRRGRLILHVAAEANPEHPDHEAYLARGQVSGKRGKE